MASVQLNKKLSNSTTDDTIIFWSEASKLLFVEKNQALNDDEINDIVEFLKSLDGDIPDTTNDEPPMNKSNI